MKSPLKRYCMALALLFTIVATGVLAQTAPTTNVESYKDFHIGGDGRGIIGQVKVVQIVGNTFYVRYNVGSTFIRVVIKTDKNTKIFRRYGDEIRSNQIGEGNILYVEGALENSSDNLILLATKIINLTNQKEIAGFKGTITGNASSAGNFILTTSNGENITLNIGTTTQIKKGTRILSPSALQVGDKVIDTTGTYDHATKSLESVVVVVYTDMKKYAPRNFEGVLKEVSTGSPQTLTFAVEGTDYKVTLPGKADILSKNRKPVSIQRFVIGDNIRVFGKIREVDEHIIDAEVIRNMSL